MYILCGILIAFTLCLSDFDNKGESKNVKRQALVSFGILRKTSSGKSFSAWLNLDKRVP